MWHNNNTDGHNNMPKISSTMKGDKVVINVNIEPKDIHRHWCIIVCSKSNYNGGFFVPVIARVMEYIYKVDTICGKESLTIEKEYLMPGEYLAVLGLGDESMTDIRSVQAADETTSEIGSLITKFDITGLSITEKDVKTAKYLLSCMANIHDENKRNDGKVFDNMMLEPIFPTIVEFLNHIVDKRDISPYVDHIKNRITLQGPILKEGKYFWPIIREGKHVEYHD